MESCYELSSVRCAGVFCITSEPSAVDRVPEGRYEADLQVSSARVDDEDAHHHVLQKHHLLIRLIAAAAARDAGVQLLICSNVPAGGSKGVSGEQVRM